MTQNLTGKLVLNFGKVIKTGEDCWEQQNWFLFKTCVALRRAVGCGEKPGKILFTKLKPGCLH